MSLRSKDQLGKAEMWSMVNLGVPRPGHTADEKPGHAFGGCT